MLGGRSWDEHQFSVKLPVIQNIGGRKACVSCCSINASLFVMIAALLLDLCLLLLLLVLLLQKGRSALVMGGSPTLSYWCFIPGDC
jgi:hypothetical protein